jgi:Domain of unknown function (DUF4157)
VRAYQRRDSRYGHEEEIGSKSVAAPARPPVLSREPHVQSLLRLQQTAGNQAVLQLLGKGEPLDSRSRARMEGAFGTSFEDVLTHTGPEARQLAQKENAAAFAMGNHIVYGESGLAPGTPVGDLLLAHELAHVVQQRDAPETVQAKSLADGGESATERDANRSAFRAVSALWGGIRQNAMPAMRSGVRLARSTGCGSSKSGFVKGTVGGQKSDDVQVTIDGAERGEALSKIGPNLVVKGSVTGVENGFAELYFFDLGDACNEANALPPDIPLWRVPIVGGKFVLVMPFVSTSTPAVGRTIMVKAGNAQVYNYACAEVKAAEAESK